ncbi:hypothetical protein BHE74_00057112 [Ensete ventricosum]|nr:hypothetical protein BHE74_00057112 [Ensete ventricosum]
MMAGSARQGWKMAATSVAAIVKGGNNGVSGEGARDDTDRGREHWRRRREEGSEDIIDGEQRHQGSLMGGMAVRRRNLKRMPSESRGEGEEWRIATRG